MSTSKWFKYEKLNEEAKMNFFCFPHAGAGASYYSQWGKIISEKYSFYPIQYPMRESRIKEKMPPSLKELAEEIAHENAEVFAAKPAVFFGHCYGELIAYETILALKRMGVQEPVLLAVSSAEAPNSTEEKMLFENASNDEVAEFFIKMGYMDRANAANKMYMDFFMPVLKNDYMLFQEYSDDKKEKINSIIFAAYSENDSGTASEKVGNWAGYSLSDFVLKSFDGGHFFLNINNLNDYLKIIDEILNNDNFEGVSIDR